MLYDSAPFILILKHVNSSVTINKQINACHQKCFHVLKSPIAENGLIGCYIQPVSRLGGLSSRAASLLVEVWYLPELQLTSYTTEISSPEGNCFFEDWTIWHYTLLRPSPFSKSYSSQALPTNLPELENQKLGRQQREGS